jgi:hypothetical protein
MLQLFDPSVLGKSTKYALVPLQPREPFAVSPETVQLDIDQDRYYAATVGYPRAISLEDARRALNALYKRWESDTFAEDPTMGTWRHEEAGFSIQLSEDEDNVVIIYIKYDLLTDAILARSFKRLGLQEKAE